MQVTELNGCIDHRQLRPSQNKYHDARPLEGKEGSTIVYVEGRHPLWWTMRKRQMCPQSFLSSTIQLSVSYGMFNLPNEAFYAWSEEGGSCTSCHDLARSFLSWN
jgi:hypothetical protein